MRVHTCYSFLPIIIYKVLKRDEQLPNEGRRFLPIIIYKVLKPVSQHGNW